MSNGAPKGFRLPAKVSLYGVLKTGECEVVFILGFGINWVPKSSSATQRCLLGLPELRPLENGDDAEFIMI